MGRQNSRSGDWLNLDSEGISSEVRERARTPRPRKTYYAVSRDLKNWKVWEKDADRQGECSREISVRPAASRRGSALGTEDPAEEASGRFYDKGKDGIPPLNEIRIQWFPPFLCGRRHTVWSNGARIPSGKRKRRMDRAES